MLPLKSEKDGKGLHKAKATTPCSNPSIILVKELLFGKCNHFSLFLLPFPPTVPLNTTQCKKKEEKETKKKKKREEGK